MCEFLYWSFPYCHEVAAWGVGVLLIVLAVECFIKISYAAAHIIAAIYQTSEQ